MTLGTWEKTVGLRPSLCYCYLLFVKLKDDLVEIISSASLCEVVPLKHDDLSHQPGIQKVIILMRIMLVMMMTILLSSMKTMSNNNDNADGNYVVAGNYVDVGKDVEEYDAPLKHESMRILVANLCLLLSLLETSSFPSSWWTWPLKDYQNIARIFSMFTQ